MSLTNSKYNPQVGDYVVWEREYWGGTLIDEGWVYFKGTPEPKKKGFPWYPPYITIETSVKDKQTCIYTSGKEMKHKKIHTLLLCHESQWCQLKYIKNRRETNETKEIHS